MHERGSLRTSSRFGRILGLVVLCLGLSAAASYGQVSPSEHEAHHAGQGQTGLGASQPASPGGAGEMMKEMGKPPRKELYPSLMELPDLPPEKRAEVGQLAHERMEAGTTLFSSGLEKLVKATVEE